MYLVTDMDLATTTHKRTPSPAGLVNSQGPLAGLGRGALSAAVEQASGGVCEGTRVRQCKACLQILNESCFGWMARDRRFRSQCKKCASKERQIYRDLHPEVRRRESKHKDLAKKKAQERRWREANPEKTLAHRVLWRAIKCGSIVRQPCAICGATNRVHAHHDDYSKPLEVMWLCARHHLLHHRRIFIYPTAAAPIRSGAGRGG